MPIDDQNGLMGKDINLGNEETPASNQQGRGYNRFADDIPLFLGRGVWRSYDYIIFRIVSESVLKASYI